MKERLTEAHDNEQQHRDDENFEDQAATLRARGSFRSISMTADLGHVSIEPRARARRFAPRPLMTLLALAVFAGLVALGRWQLDRAHQKQSLYDAFAAGAGSTHRIDSSTPPLPRFQHVALTGRYDPAHQILLDNRSDAAGRAGYEVLTPFTLDDGGLILVDRGWIGFGASRAQRPSLPVDAGERTVHGRIDRLPLPGLRLGVDPPLAGPFPVLASYPTQDAIARLLQEPATRFVRAGERVLLDATEPDGYERAWLPPGFAPMRHIAYAVQWFALALALAVIFVVTNLERSPPATPRPAQ
jgi:surfeit locus 1 family protein